VKRMRGTLDPVVPPQPQRAVAKYVTTN